MAKSTAKKATKKTTKRAKKTKAPKTDKRTSALDAAAAVLKAAGKPMGTRELIETMAAKKLWTSPGGATPHATLHAAMSREISAKGADARFVKVERGRFAYNGATK